MTVESTVIHPERVCPFVAVCLSGGSPVEYVAYVMLLLSLSFLARWSPPQAQGIEQEVKGVQPGGPLWGLDEWGEEALY